MRTKSFLLSGFLCCLTIPLVFANDYFTDLTKEDAVKVDSVSQLTGVGTNDIGPYLVEIQNNNGTNVTLRAHYFKAKNPKALVLAVHGLQSNGRWFKKTGTYLANNGISLLVYDRRGSGLSDGNLTLLQKFLRLFGIKKDFDPNKDLLGPTDQLKGHVRTGIFFRRFVFNPAQEFMSDIKASYDKLVKLNKGLKKTNGENLDVYVLANCFGSRIAIPFAKSPGLGRKVKGLFITAPATDMDPKADVTNLFKKADVATPLFHVVGPVDYIATPLKDHYFVDRRNPAYAGIHDDKVSLSLRYATGDFFFATNKLHKKMLAALPKLKTPLLIGLGQGDVMVSNARIKNRFKSQYQGPGKILTFQGDHMLEFSAAGTGFATAMNRWIDADLTTGQPASFSTKGLEGFGLIPSQTLDLGAK